MWKNTLAIEINLLGQDSNILLCLLIRSLIARQGGVVDRQYHGMLSRK